MHAAPPAGWVHYIVHAPEPHILLFRREKNYQEKYPQGLSPAEARVREEHLAARAAAAARARGVYAAPPPPPGMYAGGGGGGGGGGMAG